MPEHPILSVFPNILLAESLKITTDYYQQWDFKESSFPKDLEARGVHDIKHLPHYPYRDDGTLIWNAIK